MESFDLKKLTNEQKDMLLRVGMITVGKAIFEGLDPIEKVKKNMGTLADKIELSEEEIWEAYEFTSKAAMILGRPKQRSIIGFKHTT